VRPRYEVGEGGRSEEGATGTSGKGAGGWAGWAGEEGRGGQGAGEGLGVEAGATGFWGQRGQGVGGQEGRPGGRQRRREGRSGTGQGRGPGRMRPRSAEGGLANASERLPRDAMARSLDGGNGKLENAPGRAALGHGRVHDFSGSLVRIPLWKDRRIGRSIADGAADKRRL